MKLYSANNMSPLTLAIIVIGLAVAAGLFQVLYEGRADHGHKKEKSAYQYKRKNFFLTRAEHQCYDALLQATKGEYHIFAQVHLPTLVDHAVRGQDWRAALAHINRKSVDFVLCDKTYISAKLVIELDDKTHERPDRQERDREVERILEYAGIPLLRIEHHDMFNIDELAEKIQRALVLKFVKE